MEGAGGPAASIARPTPEAGTQPIRTSPRRRAPRRPHAWTDGQSEGEAPAPSTPRSAHRIPAERLLALTRFIVHTQDRQVTVTDTLLRNRICPIFASLFRAVLGRLGLVQKLQETQLNLFSNPKAPPLPIPTQVLRTHRRGGWLGVLSGVTGSAEHRVADRLANGRGAGQSSNAKRED